MSVDHFELFKGEMLAEIYALVYKVLHFPPSLLPIEFNLLLPIRVLEVQ